MSAPAPEPRGVFAATLALEGIVVLLALLVLPKFGEGPTVVGTVVIAVLGVAMFVAAGVQRRPWGLWFALALQVAMIACGLFVPAMYVMGGVFALVWAGLLLMRRDVARRSARGELPSQQQ